MILPRYQLKIPDVVTYHHHLEYRYDGLLKWSAATKIDVPWQPKTKFTEMMANTRLTRKDQILRTTKQRWTIEEA